MKESKTHWFASVKTISVWACILCAVAVLTRWLPHPPNFSPFAALALFSGALIANRWLAIATPLLALLISDSLLGLYPGWGVVYFAFAMTTLLGRRLHQKSSWSSVIGTSLAAGVWFFFVTNLGVWLFADYYPRTLEGLTTCFVAALPFFKNTETSTLLFSVALFAALKAMPRAKAFGESLARSF